MVSHHGIEAGLALPPAPALPDAALDAAPEAPDAALDSPLDAAALVAAALVAAALVLLLLLLFELLLHAASTSARALTPTTAAVNFLAGL
jgi:hypothetical protein